MMVKPSILVDMRKKRIRIHKHTLQAIGNPDFVLLIINPEEHTLGVKRSTLDDKLAHRVRKVNMKKKDCSHFHMTIRIMGAERQSFYLYL